MRALVFFLVLLAAAKISYQEYMYRSSTSEVIVAAYRERAISACQRDAQGQSTAGPVVWSKPESVRLVIGKSTLDVYPWQVDHALWNARYRNPYLFLSGRDKGSRVYCEFDIVHGAAAIFRM